MNDDRAAWVPTPQRAMEMVAEIDSRVVDVAKAATSGAWATVEAFDHAQSGGAGGEPPD